MPPAVIRLFHHFLPDASSANHRSPLRRDLRASMGDATAYGGMVGLGETYLATFALAVGLGEVMAGLVGSVPLVAGGIMQMISPWAIRKLGSHKRWVVACAGVQALAFLPLILAAVWGSITGPAILAVATLYWAAGLATGPAWNTWIGTIVPSPVRPRFFGIRTRSQQAAVFFGFLIGGIALQWAGTDRVLMVYAGLFSAACLCRLISAWMLSRQSEPIPVPRQMRQIPLSRVFSHLRGKSGGQLLVYLVGVQAAVQMSGPYFTPFMFRKLNFSYGQFVALISVAFLVKIVAFPIWGRFAHRVGARKLLWIGGWGIIPMGASWVVSQDFKWLLFVQMAGGVTWAAYELAFFLLFFESIPEEERTSLLTVYNLLNTSAWVLGSLCGAAILFLMGGTFESYLWVFGLSSLGRGLALILLAKLPAVDVAADEVSIRTVAVRVNATSPDAPVLPSMPDQMVEPAGMTHESD
jgi:MFS family permease